MSVEVTKLEPLPPNAKKRKGEILKILQDHQQSFLDAAIGLSEFRDDRLYRDEFHTFDEFCVTTLHWSVRYVNYLIKSAQAVKSLNGNNCSQITNEAQARELAAAPPEMRDEIVDAVAKEGAVTAEAIRKERQKRTPPNPRKPKVAPPEEPASPEMGTIVPKSTTPNEAAAAPEPAAATPTPPAAEPSPVAAAVPMIISLGHELTECGRPRPADKAVKFDVEIPAFKYLQLRDHLNKAKANYLSRVSIMRDQKLYAPKYSTFEAFCAAELDARYVPAGAPTPSEATQPLPTPPTPVSAPNPPVPHGTSAAQAAAFVDPFAVKDRLPAFAARLRAHWASRTSVYGGGTAPSRGDVALMVEIEKVFKKEGV